MKGRGGVRRPVRAGVVVVGVVVVAVAVAGAVGGCSRVRYRDLAVGECLPSSARVVGEREQDPTRVPCSAEHRYEVYAVLHLSLPPEWPGQAMIDEVARRACEQSFQPRTGVDPMTLDDADRVVSVTPTESSWTDEKDRTVECLLRLGTERSGAFLGRAE